MDWFADATNHKQGLLGELKARFMMTHLGYETCTPDGIHVPFDLLAVKDGQMFRVQVKTSRSKPAGKWAKDGTFAVNLITSGGNTTVNTRKKIDKSQVDLLFVMVTDGRCWLIPFDKIEATSSIVVGISKYDEYQIC